MVQPQEPGLTGSGAALGSLVWALQKFQKRIPFFILVPGPTYFLFFTLFYLFNCLMFKKIILFN